MDRMGGFPVKLTGVEIGQKAEVIAQRKDAEAVYESSIADFGNGVVLLMPLVNRGMRQRLDPQWTYSLVITTKFGIFKVSADFIGEKEEQEGVFPAFRLSGEKQKIQRRNHCRLTKILDARIVAEQREDDQQGVREEQKEQPEQNGCEVTILDLSAGGLRISSKTELDEDCLYEIYFEIPDEKKTQIRCKGAIVWHNWNDHYRIHQYGIQFEVIRQSVQDRIFQYIFWQQAMEARLG